MSWGFCYLKPKHPVMVAESTAGQRGEGGKAPGLRAGDGQAPAKGHPDTPPPAPTVPFSSQGGQMLLGEGTDARGAGLPLENRDCALGSGF